MVEFLTQGVDAADAVALEGGEQLTLGDLDPRDQPGEGLIATMLIAQAVEGAAQVIGHRQQIAGEPADRVFGGVLALALSAAAQILGLGHGAQQAVLGVVEIGAQALHRVFGRLIFGVVRVFVHGFIIRDLGPVLVHLAIERPLADGLEALGDVLRGGVRGGVRGVVRGIVCLKLLVVLAHGCLV